MNIVPAVHLGLFLRSVCNNLDLLSWTQSISLQMKMLLKDQLGSSKEGTL